MTKTGSRPRTASARGLRSLDRALAARGVAMVDVLRAAGVDPAVLRDPKRRIPRERLFDVWHRAAELSRCPNIGLLAGAAVNLGSHPALQYVLATSRDLRVGYTSLARYYRVVAGTPISAEADGDRLELRYETPMLLPGGAVEFVVAAWVRMGRLLTGVGFSPIAVQFAHECPGAQDEYNQFFGCEVGFGAEETSMLFGSAVLCMRPDSVTPDPQWVATRGHPAGLLQQGAMRRTLLNRVREAVAEEIRDGNPSPARVASRLATSSRTLQRRLQELGVTHRQVVDELRRDLAVYYMREAGLSIGEVAYLLGFSEASAFHRAFKRWTVMPPLAYCEQAPRETRVAEAP